MIKQLKKCIPTDKTSHWCMCTRKCRRSLAHPHPSGKSKYFFLYVGGLFATIFFLRRAFFAIWGPSFVTFCLIWFFFLRGEGVFLVFIRGLFWLTTPPPPTTFSAGAHTLVGSNPWKY